jgi:hypothetical protein
MLFATLTLFTTPQLTKAVIITEWTFETSELGGQIVGNWITNITAEVGSGTASAWHHSVFPVDYTFVNGNGSYRAFGVTNDWTVGDFFQFAISTAGYQNIAISYDQAGNLTGPGTFFLEYSIDGRTFTKFGSDYKVNVGHWTYSSTSTTNSFSFDLSSVTSINGQPTVYFRVVDGSTVAIGGGTVSGYEEDGIDNFLVSAQPVPEPSTMALAVLGGTFGAFISKRKRVKS